MQCTMRYCNERNSMFVLFLFAENFLEICEIHAHAFYRLVSFGFCGTKLHHMAGHKFGKSIATHEKKKNDFVIHITGCATY